MKKKIAILGSTGSIGKSLIDIILKNKKQFDVILLTANTNDKLLLKQATRLNAKNIIINDKLKFHKINKKKNNFKVYNNFKSLKKILNIKLDYIMSAITGIEGLEPTYLSIKHTKTIAIANKESIICGWGILQKELNKYKTNFIPVDSEHFSMWYALKNIKEKSIENIYLTASGGPLLKTNIKKFKNISVTKALRHPNWKMGKKITIDSATMINKVYEVIEAKNLFNTDYEKLNILIHPKSYVHAILKFSNGMIKIIAHDTTMKIPIFNTIYNNNKKINSKKINLNILNNLDFEKVDRKRFPMIDILKILPKKQSLFETLIVSANDTLVNLFLKKKIKFTDIQKELFKIIKSKEFVKLKNLSPKNISDILKINDYVRLKILKKVYKFSNV